MNNRTEAKLKSIDGMRKAMTEILAQAWERGKKYGMLEAQESSSWIPLTDETVDRLKDHHWYLITHKHYKTPIKAQFHSDGLQHFTYHDEGGAWACSYYYSKLSENDVLAWMPLPEPYTKEDS